MDTTQWVEPLLSMCKALDLIDYTGKEEGREEGSEVELWD